MAAHASLGASSAHRWMNCPGSIRMIEQVPESDQKGSSKYAEEGSAAHALCEECLVSGRPADYYLGKGIVQRRGDWVVLDRRLRGTEEGFHVTVEMAEAVQVYLDEVAHHVERLPHAELFVEKTVQPLGREDMFGTADAIIAEPFGELVILDYKHGKGVVVEVEYNAQAMYYGLGAMRAVGGPAEFDKITLVIVQPRAPHEDGAVRRHAYDPRELAEWGDVLAAAAKRTEDEDAPLAAGDWCRFCPAAAICPEMRRKATSQVRDDFADLIQSGVELATEPAAHVRLPDPRNREELAQALHLVPLLDWWAREVEGMAQRALEAGGTVPGFKLVRKRANRRWKDEEALLEELKRRRDVKADDYLTEPKLRSPAQLERIKALGKDFVAEHAIKPEGGLTVTRAEDPRLPAPPPVLTDFADLMED